MKKNLSMNLAVGLIGFIAALQGSVVRAQVLPTEDKTVNRTFPPEPGFENDTKYKKAFEDMKSQVDVLRRQAEGAQRTLMATGAQPVVVPKGAAGGGFGSAKPRSKRTSGRSMARGVVPSEGFARGNGSSASRLSSRAAQFQQTSELASPAQSFAVTQIEENHDAQTVLPTGSFVRAKLVSGVEANALEPYPVLLHLQEAFTGPNKTRIDLSHCFMIAKARANLSTERVIMETDSLSCVRDNGEHFKTQARGYTAGDDSSFGSTGTFISKQGQVLLAAVLANIAKNAGEAVALAQQSTAVVGIDKVATATNITGDKANFIAGKSMVDASATVAQWYLDYAKQLIPSIGIGSGQTVHVVILDSVRVPTLEVEE